MSDYNLYTSDKIFSDDHPISSVADLALTISSKFLKSSIDDHKWKKIFVDAGKTVADFETDETEDSELRRVTFSQEAMQELASELETSLPFCLFEDCEAKVSKLQAQNDFTSYNAQVCRNRFLKILFSEIGRAFPELVEYALLGNQYGMMSEIYTIFKSGKPFMPVLGYGTCSSKCNDTIMDVLDEENNDFSYSRAYQQESSEANHSDDHEDNESLEWILAHLEFPRFEKQEEIKAFISEVITCWKEERERYPGWYILPATKCEELRWKTTLFSQWIDLDILRPEQKLEFCYEYIWRCETAMLCYESNMVSGIYSVWQNCNPDKEENSWMKNDDSLNHWFECGLMLLREYRERGEYPEWEKIYRVLSKYEKIVVTAETRLKIEEIKFAFSKLDMGKVRLLRDNLDISEDEYAMRLTKYNMEAECGDVKNALDHIEGLKTDILEILNSGESDNNTGVYIRSLYGVVLRVESMLQQGVAFTYGKYEENQGKINEILKEAEKWSAYFDWNGIVNYVKNGLLKWEAKKEEKQPPFELNKQTVSLFSENTVCTESYYLYRVVDRMGIPLECCHVTLLGDIMVPWIDALQELNPQLALFLTLRGNKKSSVTVCYDRKHIFSLGPDIVSKQLLYLTDVFNNNLDELSEKGAWNSKGVCFSLRSMLLEIMPRCMVYCPDDLERSILILLKEIMDRENLNADMKTLQFVNKMLSMISERNKLIMLNEMLKTKIFDHHSDKGSNQYEDLFEAYFRKENLREYTSLVQLDQNIIEELLRDEEDPDDVWRSKIVRLTMLHYLGLLSEGQEIALTKKIWSRVNEETGLPTIKDWNLWNYLDLNYGDDQCPVISVKHQLLKDGMMKLYREDQKYYMTWGNISYLDYLIAVSIHREKDFWSVEDVETIFRDAIDYWNIAKKELSKNNNTIISDDLKHCVRQMFLTLPEVYKTITGTISEKMQEEIRIMLNEADELDFATARLRAFFIPDQEREEFTKDLGKLLHSWNEEISVDAIGCAEDLLEKYPNEVWTDDLFESLLSILYDRTLPGLETVIIILHNLMYRNCPVLTEERIQKIDGALVDLGEWSRYSYHCENENSIKEAAKIRRACTSLAYQILCHIDEDKCPGAKYWKDNCNDNEFNDVKNEMLMV